MNNIKRTFGNRRYERSYKRSAVIGSIHNISLLINSRRQTLYMMRENLVKGFEADQPYKMRTIYFQGPKVLQELEKLIKIRHSLRKYLTLI